MNYESLLNAFLTSHGFMDNPNFIGVLFYGSCMQGVDNSNSDVDVILIFDNTENLSIKGTSIIDNKNIEYFCRSLKSLYTRIHQDFDSHSDSILSILGYGQILVDRTGEIGKARDYVLDLYKNGIKLLSDDEVSLEIHSLNSKMETLKNLYVDGDPQFYPFYYLLLEKTRLFYQQRFGYSNISSSKVYKMYTNPIYSVAQHKKLPPIEFINAYIECLICREPSKMIENMQTIFLLCKSGIELDFKNIQLNLGRMKY